MIKIDQSECADLQKSSSLCFSEIDPREIVISLGCKLERWRQILRDLTGSSTWRLIFYEHYLRYLIRWKLSHGTIFCTKYVDWLCDHRRIRVRAIIYEEKVAICLRVNWSKCEINKTPGRTGNTIDAVQIVVVIVGEIRADNCPTWLVIKRWRATETSDRGLVPNEFELKISLSAIENPVFEFRVPVKGGLPLNGIYMQYLSFKSGK
jgi:predicted RNA-binding protein YlqC (UPF0109 family)